MTSAGEFELASAEAVLAGTASERNRMACWLARSALESAVDELVLSSGWDAGSASMRSKLTVLQVLQGDRTVAAQAHYAWARLSRACHQHSYELSPAYSEVRDLLAQVSAVCRLAGRGGLQMQIDDARVPASSHTN